MFRPIRVLLFLLLSVTIASYLLTPATQSQGANRSVLLNGTSSYVDVPYNANLNITGALTLEAWVKTSSTAYQHVLERGDWFNNQMSYDLTLSESKARLDIMQSNGSYTTVIGSTAMSLTPGIMSPECTTAARCGCTWTVCWTAQQRRR